MVTEDPWEEASMGSGHKLPPCLPCLGKGNPFRSEGLGGPVSSWGSLQTSHTVPSLGGLQASGQSLAGDISSNWILTTSRIGLDL